MVSDFLRLVRFPLIFTALADPIAGYCLALPREAPVRFAALLPLLLASAALYAAGMVLNDCNDLVRDRTLHPRRPLAAGRVPFSAAYGFGVVLAVVALVSAQCAGLRAGAVALGIALGILLYDGVTKRHVLSGALTMGALRAGNVLLGIVAALPDGAPSGKPLGFVALIFVYVTLLTILSTLEEPPPRPRLFVGLVSAMAVAAVVANVVALENHPLILGVTLLQAATLLYKGLSMPAEFDPGLVSEMVRIGVLGIIPLDAVAAFGTGHWPAGIGILCLLAPPIALLTGFVRLPWAEKAN